MCFVKRAIHSHGDGELIQVAILPYLVDDSSQTSAAELGGTAGHHTAHLLHQHAVVARGASEAQVLQDRAHLSHGKTVTVGSQRTKCYSTYGYAANRALQELALVLVA